MLGLTSKLTCAILQEFDKDVPVGRSDIEDREKWPPQLRELVRKLIYMGFLLSGEKYALTDKGMMELERLKKALHT